jgi:hypothetical protein
MVAMKRRRPFNRRNISFNIDEAIEELQKLLGKANDGTLKEEELQIGLLHAYHHLNFAWNTRRISKSEYSHQMQARFKQWGKYPSDIEDL